MTYIIYYNKPTICSFSQSILFHCRVTLHVSGAFHSHHQEYIKLYLQPPVHVILSLQLPSSKLAKFELNSILGWRKVAATIIWHVTEAVDTVLCTPDDGCGKYPKHVEWPCSEIKLTANSCILLVYYNINYDARNHKHKIQYMTWAILILTPYSDHDLTFRHHASSI